MSKPVLYLMVGYPGAGKTSLARIITEATAAIHIWADDERHKMFPNPTHSEEESLKLYETLNKRVEQLLSEGYSVVFDTNFNFYDDRQKLREIAVQADAECKVIWLTTPESVARERAVCPPQIRNGYQVGMSDEQFNQIIGKLEPPKVNENLIKLDASNLDKSTALATLGLV